MINYSMPWLLQPASLAPCLVELKRVLLLGLSNGAGEIQATISSMNSLQPMRRGS